MRVVTFDIGHVVTPWDGEKATGRPFTDSLDRGDLTFPIGAVTPQARLQQALEMNELTSLELKACATCLKGIRYEDEFGQELTEDERQSYINNGKRIYLAEYTITADVWVKEETSVYDMFPSMERGE